MNLSISNIAWSSEYDESMYQFLKDNGYKGLEIAPTRIFPEMPYDHLSEAKDWAQQLKEKYGLVVPSMQSIWFGRQERIFGGKMERKALIDYTRKACRFAKAIGCKNLVFGNPKNRDTDDVIGNYPIAIDFFHTLGEMAVEHDTIIAIEPNPTIYNTRFINNAMQAAELANKANSEGVKVNFDLGAVIQNDEDIKCIELISDLVNHVHISEPYLRPIDENHEELHHYLMEFGNSHHDIFISIEMGRVDNDIVKNKVEYISKLKIGYEKE